MAKARVGFYEIKGDTLARTHRACPKCGPGWFLAEHANRRSCGHCGYMETKAPSSTPAPAAAAPAPKKETKAPKPKAPKPPAAPAAAPPAPAKPA